MSQQRIIKPLSWFKKWMLNASLGLLLLTSAQALCAAESCVALFHTSQWSEKSAFETVFNDRAVPWPLRFQVGKALGKTPWSLTSQQLKVQPQTKEALRFLVQNSQSTDARKFRKKLFKAIPKILSEHEALEILLPFARGASNVIPEDLYFSNQAIQKIGSMYGSFPKRYTEKYPRTDSRDILLHEPVAAISNLGGGWNTTLLVRFKNGQKAVFKPFLGQKNLGHPKDWLSRVAFVREVTAVSLIEIFLGNKQSRENGISEIVTPDTQEVSLVHKGVSYGLGSLQIFVEGVENATKLKEHSPQTWAHLLQDSKWQRMEVRVRTIDYILGNPDRFENAGYKIPHYEAANLNNLMIPQNFRPSDHLTAVLIDNAFGRPGNADFSESYLPPLEMIPADLKEAILNFNENSFTHSFQGKLPDEGIYDVITRINILKKLLLTEKPL